MKKERVEDLGILYEKLKAIVDDYIFEYTGSKHEYEHWVAQFDKEQTLYDIHMKMRFLHEQICECISIARGDDE